MICLHDWIPAYWRERVPSYEWCQKCHATQRITGEPRMNMEEARKALK